MGRFFIILFFGINKRAAKTSQCMVTKLGTQLGTGTQTSHATSYE